jgi:GNAT superfamily N-acetyltransferase
MIEQVKHAEVLKRFGKVYYHEKLSCKQIDGAEWYADEYTCASLYWINANKARIKATVTLPEYRGFGYGSAMLTYLLQVISDTQRPVMVESYAKNPKWYLEHGFTVHRTTQWGVTVVRAQINGSN